MALPSSRLTACRCGCPAPRVFRCPMSPPPPHFSTPRLRLRPFEPQDLSQLQRYAVREAFWRHLPLDRQTDESVAAFLDRRLADRWGEGGFQCAVELLAVGHIIGTIRISVTSTAHRAGDIGFALDDEHRGQGYMTEAARHILSVGFDDLGLHRIWASASVDNVDSWRLMERIGMRREGLLRDHKCIRGSWRDSYLYSVLETDG